jgi:hypothetical protein
MFPIARLDRQQELLSIVPDGITVNEIRTARDLEQLTRYAG